MCLSKKRYASWRETQDDFAGYKASLGPHDIDSLFEFLGRDFPASGLPFTRDAVKQFVSSDETELWSEGFIDPLSDEYPVRTAAELCDVLRALRHDLRRSQSDWENPTLDCYIEALDLHLQTRFGGGTTIGWADLASWFKTARRNEGVEIEAWAVRAGTPTGDQLAVCWHHDHDGTGRLALKCHSQGFAGTGRAWFANQTVVEFADRLTQFPLDADDPPTLSGGIDARDSYRELVGVTVVPHGNRGQIDVRVHLATDLDLDLLEGQHESTLHLLTTYQRLADFGNRLRAVVQAPEQTEVVLEGERLD